MTGVKTGVKGDFQANIAPKTPEICPPVPAPNENEFGSVTQTQDLINSILKIFKDSHINVVITSRGIS